MRILRICTNSEQRTLNQTQQHHIRRNRILNLMPTNTLLPPIPNNGTLLDLRSSIILRYRHSFRRVHHLVLHRLTLLVNPQFNKDPCSTISLNL